MLFCSIFGFSGCKLFHQGTLPTAFSSRTPGLTEIEDVVNRNSQRIHSMRSENASVTLTSVSQIGLKTDISLERPKRLRMRGGMSFSGDMFDIGSNDDVFWVWYRQHPERLVYTARHESYANSAMRQSIPIDPGWVVESLGIVEFRPDETHEGPYTSSNGLLQVRTIRNTASGQVQKVTTIDPGSSAILQQDLYDANGQWITRSRLSNHAIDKETQILYAKRIEIETAGIDGKIIIVIDNPQFNKITPENSTALFSKPYFPNFTEYDISAPPLTQQQSSTAPYGESIFRNDDLRQQQSYTSYNPDGAYAQAYTAIRPDPEVVLTAQRTEGDRNATGPYNPSNQYNSYGPVNSSNGSATPYREQDYRR